MLQTRIIPSKPVLISEGDKKNIIVTDIHIGFESNMASNDIFIGSSTTTDETVNEILDIIDEEKPDSIILLGDIKSSTKSITTREWEEVPKFFERIKEKCEVVLVPGNHDANLQKLAPSDITFISTAGMVEENTLLTHGHTMPPNSFSYVDKIIMGHIHPVFFQEDSIMNGQRVWLSIKADKEDIFPDRTGEIEITVMPSFNNAFYATHKRNSKRSISPIINRVQTIQRAKIVTLDGTIIGDESMIRDII